MGLNVMGVQSDVRPEHTCASGPLHRLQPWYEAYMAALFESDRTRIADRIRQAESLILSRARELRNGQPDIAEQRALDNALHALRALTICMKK